MKVTFGGNPVELEGREIHVGDVLENFTAVKNDLSSFQLSEITGKKLIIAVPSLDTSVCDMEVRRFNQEASSLEGVSLITISMDLPFAQKRWCGAAGIDRVLTVSDYKDRDFAHKSGTYLPHVGLLARAIFLLDESNKVLYAEYVPEVTDHPNYQKALEAARS